MVGANALAGRSGELRRLSTHAVEGTQMQFLVTVDLDGEGRWAVNCPAIPGSALRAESRDEAFAGIRRTIKACLEMRAGRKLAVRVEVLPFYLTEQGRGSEVTWTGENERIA